MITPGEIAARFGSPAYLYDLDRVAAAARDLWSYLPAPATLFFSLKANPHPDVAAQLRSAGCYAEISSQGELSSAVEAGFAGRECLYTGPGKTPTELGQALAAGVRLFSVESSADLHRIAGAAIAHQTEADVLLRVNSLPTGVGTGLRMSGTASQFGFDSEHLMATWRALRTPSGVRPVGLHFFPLSNARDEESLLAEAEHSVATAAEVSGTCGISVRFLDLGGGFAAPYAAPGARPRYDTFGNRLASTLDRHFPGWRRGEPQVAFESGRYLVGDCGTLITTVLDVKTSKGRMYAVLDAGINVLGGMSSLGRILPASARPVATAALTVDDAGGTGESGDSAAAVDLVGPLCTPADVLGHAVPISPTPGQILAIPNVGAYGLTASLIGFLGRPTPLEVLVQQGDVVGHSRLVLERTREGSRLLQEIPRDLSAC